MIPGTTDIPEGPLRQAPGLRTRCDAAGHVLVETPVGGVIDAGPQGHRILGLFAEPTSISQALARLEAGPGRHLDRMPAAAVVAKLVAAGAVTTEAQPTPVFGWSDPAEHARMVSDDRRTGAFLAAIDAAVGPDDIVLDVGTGSGILAVAAARAGARHVYAVESTDIARVAHQVFELNGVSDRVTLVEGWSTEVSLPERATLMVTETLGVEPWDEDILATVLDARERLLVPRARTIPASLSLQVQALRVPDAQRWASRVDAAEIASWRDRYGIDLSPLRDACRRTPLHWPIDCRTVAGWSPLGPPVELLSVDLEGLTSTRVRASTTARTDGGGLVDAILVTFTANLSEGIRLAHRPRPDESPSWDASVWFLPEALQVDAGAILRVEYRYGVPGEADGLTCHVSPGEA